MACCFRYVSLHANRADVSSTVYSAAFSLSSASLSITLQCKPDQTPLKDLGGKKVNGQREARHFDDPSLYFLYSPTDSLAMGIWMGRRGGKKNPASLFMQSIARLVCIHNCLIL